MMKKLIREPYIHFLLMGSFLYMVYSHFNPEQNISDVTTIEVSHFEVESLEQDFNLTWQRKPTASELRLLVEERFFKEVLLHEAESLGLSRTDKIVRKRLLAKMKHILVSSSPVEEPSEEILYAYYKDHLTRYSHTKRLSFSHIYFEGYEYQGLDQMVQQLNRSSVNPHDAKSYGDSFHAQQSFTSVDLDEVETVFGQYFSRALRFVSKGHWVGPVRSKYGLHIVYLTDKEVSKAYAFDDVQTVVYQDYLAQKKNKVFNDAYQKIATQYELKSPE